MKVLIACEFSGVVRDAFSRKGHDAWSCDLLPTESEMTRQEGKHIQGDVLELLEDESWDMMIAHPPCTYLCSSGLHWNKRVEGRDKLTHEAMLFVLNLMGVGFIVHRIPFICLENPIGCISSNYRKPDQIIQPWMFGHAESKSTCLWLKGLPKLKPTKIADFKSYRCKCGNVFDADAGKYGCCEVAAKPLWDNMTPSGQNKLGPSENRWKERSVTYSGIGEAMANQWGDESKLFPDINLFTNS